MTRKEHWERVYSTKQPSEVSWTQEVPQTSLDLIQRFGLPKSARIIDVGGGDSRLVDYLLDEGYTHLSVLDISHNAIERAKARLGARAGDVEWIVGDITEFTPQVTYDIWHDRATFHFLTEPSQIERYISTAYSATNQFLALGTFSTDGPEKCSGLTVQRYDEASIESQLSERFSKIECFTEDHTTPFGTTQNFLFCSFKKLGSPQFP